MQRIGRDIAVFFDADGGPVAKSDFAKVAAAGGADRAAFLLASVDPVGQLVVGDDVIELRGGLVVPGTPGLAAIHADGRALVHGDGDDVGIFGIDPDGVVVIAAGRAFDGGEILAGVIGAVDAATLLCVNPGIHAVGITGGDGGADAANTIGFAGQSFGELMPG